MKGSENADLKRCSVQNCCHGINSDELQISPIIYMCEDSKESMTTVALSHRLHSSGRNPSWFKVENGRVYS